MVRETLTRRVTETVQAAGCELGYPEYVEKLCDSMELAHHAAKAYCWYIDHLTSADGELKILGGMDFWLARLGYELRVLERALEDFLIHIKLGAEEGHHPSGPHKDSEATFYRVDAMLRDVFSSRQFKDAYSAPGEGESRHELPLSQGLSRLYQELNDLAQEVEHIEAETLSVSDLSHLLMDMELALGYKTLPRLADMAPAIRHQWARVKY